MEYPIYLGEDDVGTALVNREGLYYRIKCTCHLSGDVPLRITACAEHAVDLGLCILDGDLSGLEVRIPMKRLGEGKLQFFIKTQHKKLPENWFPISPEEPFHYIKRLKDAYLVVNDGSPGIAIRNLNQFQDPPDNDLNP